MIYFIYDKERNLMKKIKIKNNSFEIPYLDEEGTDYSTERLIIKRILELFSDSKCFVLYSVRDEAFSKSHIVNYIKRSKYRRMIEVEKFLELNDIMFEGWETAFYFMPKTFMFSDFVSIKFWGNIFKKHQAKLILYLDEFGFITVTYNSLYDKQIKDIIDEYSLK